MTEKEIFTLEDGRLLIKFARDNIEYYLENDRRIPILEEIKRRFSENYGAFVTLNRIDVEGNPLRGCIGYIEPIYPLFEIIHRVSISSALEDPRFQAITKDELDKIIIELSILTPPKLLKVEDPNDYLKLIIIGRDGLIAEKGMRRGLLLPQVPVDHGRKWDVETFLRHTCNKAYLPDDAWKEKDTKIYSFQAILFEEEEPDGEVKRKYLVP